MSRLQSHVRLVRDITILTHDYFSYTVNNLQYI